MRTKFTKEIFIERLTKENKHRHDLLDCYILCVNHYGTSWDYVYCDTTNEYAKRELGEDK